MSYTPFTYDAIKAKVLLTQYIKNTIKPEILPTKIEAKQGLSIYGITESDRNQFGSMFISNNSTISANFHYEENSNTKDDFEVFIQLASVAPKTATAPLANPLLSLYFINPYLISNCNTEKTFSYCENFQVVNDGKKGYGILIEKPIFIAFSCFIPKESKYYNTEKSCISP